MRTASRGTTCACSASAAVGAFRNFNESEGISTAKGARRLIAKINRSFNGTAWAHRAHADKRGTYAGWLVPIVQDEEIASILGVSIGTSKSQLHRARLLLRDALTQEPRHD